MADRHKVPRGSNFNVIFGDGRFWMWGWTAVTAIMFCWGVLTFIFWFDSVRNVNALSVVANWLACFAGFQATLGMRKADPKDDF